MTWTYITKYQRPAGPPAGRTYRIIQDSHACGIMPSTVINSSNDRYTLSDSPHRGGGAWSCTSMLVTSTLVALQRITRIL